MDYYKLNSKNLPRLSERVSVPKYDRTKVKAGILHIGIGGFHRAHEAFYTDELLNGNSDYNWGICGVALLDFDQKIYQTLKDQNGLYTLIVKELDGTLTKTIIGSIVDYLFAPENPTAVIQRIANPDIKIITLTITEGGYNYNEATGEFEINNPLIQHDLKNPNDPKTVFGYLTQGLKLRKEGNISGCTIQSCDNIQGNGHVTKKMLLSYVKHAEPELVSWIESHVSFPNSMVDRITPATVPADITALKETSGILDEWPVVCEPFKQWVIEDDFIEGRPVWEQVGAQFVEDVVPYEKMKLSLLNAGHSVLGILGTLIGYATIDEVVNDDAVRAFLSAYMENEVTPTLGKLEGVDLKDYMHSLIQRFGNIYIKDQVDRICSESSAKIPKFILPTIHGQLNGNGSIDLAAFVIAAWAIYGLGVDENGNKIQVRDAMEGVLRNKAIASKTNPKTFLEIEPIFGSLADSESFVETYTKAYKDIMQFGVKKCIIDMNSKFLNNLS